MSTRPSSSSILGSPTRLQIQTRSRNNVCKLLIMKAPCVGGSACASGTKLGLPKFPLVFASCQEYGPLLQSLHAIQPSLSFKGSQGNNVLLPLRMRGPAQSQTPHVSGPPHRGISFCDMACTCGVCDWARPPLLRCGT